MGLGHHGVEGSEGGKVSTLDLGTQNLTGNSGASKKDITDDMRPAPTH